MSTNHTYHTPGDYTVSITATNNGGQGVDDIYVYISGWSVWFIYMALRSYLRMFIFNHLSFYHFVQEVMKCGIHDV